MATLWFNETNHHLDHDHDGPYDFIDTPLPKRYEIEHCRRKVSFFISRLSQEANTRHRMKFIKTERGKEEEEERDTSKDEKERDTSKNEKEYDHQGDIKHEEYDHRGGKDLVTLFDKPSSIHHPTSSLPISLDCILPWEVMEIIFGYLDKKTLATFCSVSKHCYNICSQDKYWSDDVYDISFGHFKPEIWPFRCKDLYLTIKRYEYHIKQILISLNLLENDIINSHARTKEEKVYDKMYLEYLFKEKLKMNCCPWRSSTVYNRIEMDIPDDFPDNIDIVHPFIDDHIVHVSFIFDKGIYKYDHEISFIISFEVGHTDILCKTNHIDHPYIGEDRRYRHDDMKKESLISIINHIQRSFTSIETLTKEDMYF